MGFFSFDCRQSVIAWRGVFAVDAFGECLGVGVCIETIMILIGFYLHMGCELVHIAFL